MQLLRLEDYRLLYDFYKLTLPVNRKQILLTSLSRNDLSGNLFYIDRELRKGDYDIRHAFYWKKKLSFREKKELCRLYATSAYIIVDAGYKILYGLDLRKETQFIQVWHALGAFKRMGGALAGKENMMPVTHRNYSLAIVSAQGVVNDYAKAFLMDPSKVLPLGAARTDVFFDETYREEVRKRYYEKYPQLKGRKVILFAPTFRQIGNENGRRYYDFSSIDLQSLETLGDEYCCIIKLHPYIENTYEGCRSSFFLDLTAEREINDLLFIADFLITDYSSVIFEASLLDLKTIFYVPDIEKYASDRGFFYPYEDYLIGPAVKTTEELINSIRNYSRDEDKLIRFREKFVSACDGHSAERFVRRVIENK